MSEKPQEGAGLVILGLLAIWATYLAIHAPVILWLIVGVVVVMLLGSGGGGGDHPCGPGGESGTNP